MPTMQTFENNELKSSIRAKINSNFTTINSLFKNALDYVTASDADSGAISSKTVNSITDTTKNWVAGSLVGKAVKLSTANEEDDYAIIASNSNNVLVFDDNHANYSFVTYRILSTFNASTDNSIMSFNILSNDGALILPPVTTVTNRTTIFAYIELANEGPYKLAVICSGTDRQRGKKWGSLNYKYEGVDLMSHNTITPHWDTIRFENIKRYANVNTTVDTAITSATYLPILTPTNSSLTLARRFSYITVSGNRYLKYQSIATSAFRVSGSLTISRAGGGTSIVLIKVRIKSFTTGLYSDSTVYSKVKFTGDTTQNVTIDIPITLEPNDEATLVIQRDSGTVTLETGSTMTLIEM